MAYATFLRLSIEYWEERRPVTRRVRAQASAGSRSENKTMNSKVLLLAAAAALLVLGAPKPAAKAMTAMIPTIDEDETGVAQVREPQRERVRSARVHSSGSRNDDGMRKSGAGSSSSSKAASSSRSSGAGGGKSISKTVGTSSVAGG